MREREVRREGNFNNREEKGKKTSGNRSGEKEIKRNSRKEM